MRPRPIYTYGDWLTVTLASIICALAFFALLALFLATTPIHARDLDGRYAGSPLKSWFDSLASGKGLCCSFADGQTIEDVDWDTKDGKYRVRLGGAWVVVPDDALVTVPNKFGQAVVWPYVDGTGKTQIRCFIPGSGA